MKRINPQLAVLAIAGIAAVLPGCGTGQASVADQAEVRAATPVPVETAAPSRADIFATYMATATIESDADAPVLAKVGGEIVQVLVEEGDVVEAGPLAAPQDELARRLRVRDREDPRVRQLLGQVERHRAPAAAEVQDAHAVLDAGALRGREQHALLRRVEAVAMPVGAVCVSTQVGCAVGCRFCASGLFGVERNLEVGEIVEQVVHARRAINARGGPRLERVVYMGMGEPSHNLEAVLAAAAALRERRP